MYKLLLLLSALMLMTFTYTGCLDAEDDDDDGASKTDTLQGEVTVLPRALNFDDEKGSAGNLVTDHLLSGDLAIENCLFYKFGESDWNATTLESIIKWSDVADDVDKSSIMSTLKENNTFGSDPGVSRTSLLPSSGSLAFTASRKTLTDPFFDNVDYVGAFGSANWMEWTFTHQMMEGEVTDVDASSFPEKTITDDDITGNVTLSSDTVYILDGFVFVEDGSTLTIEAGTVIKAKAGGGLSASALIVARGGFIDAQGTASEPIIMTAMQDDLRYQDDINPETRGLWGGLIVLGKSITNRAAGEEQIEGIDPDDNRGLYGGSDLSDNSGTIKYVSLRYGGTNIGEGNEINGLTMGGVGSGTTIENIEVYHNADDGFEWFGGTVNTKYLVSTGNSDDSFDWDEGFRGKGQFWVVIQASDAGDRGAEMDGCAGDNRGNTSEYSKPTIANATFIGSGHDSGNSGNMIFKFREETGGYYYNSIFTDFYGDVKISH
ncbi:MAG: carboxypeptidase regulatory-like domain-containing protein [Fibrobacterota bacterium]